MIQPSSATRHCCLFSHSSFDIGVGSRPQKILSSSITGRPVILLRRKARVDFPEPPRPRIRIRFNLENLLASAFAALRINGRSQLSHALHYIADCLRDQFGFVEVNPMGASLRDQVFSGS